jgi:hypothetical protein
MANSYSTRIWKITGNETTPFGTTNVKFKGGTWTGFSTDATFSITDEAGEVTTWKATADGSVVSFTELGWVSGPMTFTFTGTTYGEVNLFLGTK